MKKLSNRGDTIVEVLLALMVIGLVVAGAYASASRSLRTARISQERAEAVKLAENQLEQLKSLIPFHATPTMNVFRSDTEAFCITTVNEPRLSPGTPNPDLFADALDGSVYATECQRTDNRYFISIQRTNTSNLFTVRVRWERLGGGRDEVKMVYRAYRL